MSQENVEIVKAGMEAWNAVMRQFEQLRETWDAEALEPISASSTPLTELL